MKQAIAWNEETEENITENGIVLNAIAYIREHYMEAVGLQDVAQCCNVSQNTSQGFSRKRQV